jgi:hypothetical protein
VKNPTDEDWNNVLISLITTDLEIVIEEKKKPV